jgi:hypothetical protein
MIFIIFYIYIYFIYLLNAIKIIKYATFLCCIFIFLCNILFPFLEKLDSKTSNFLDLNIILFIILKIIIFFKQIYIFYTFFNKIMKVNNALPKSSYWSGHLQFWLSGLFTQYCLIHILNCLSHWCTWWSKYATPIYSK